MTIKQRNLQLSDEVSDRIEALRAEARRLYGLRLSRSEVTEIAIRRFRVTDLAINSQMVTESPTDRAAA